VGLLDNIFGNKEAEAKKEEEERLAAEAIIRAEEEAARAQREKEEAELREPPSISKIQSRLNGLGYGAGEVDGIMGPLTEGAIKAFQRDNGLDVDGIVGPITRKALGI